MNKLSLGSIIAIGIGVGTAIAIALQNNAVGIAVGAGFIASQYSQIKNSGQPKNKSPEEPQE